MTTNKTKYYLLHPNKNIRVVQKSWIFGLYDIFVKDYDYENYNNELLKISYKTIY